MATSVSPEERELNLVLKLELRLGSANSDEKLQALLHTYLAPLLLKLASEHVSVRNKVIAVCQYLTRRLKTSPDVSLPVPALLKQFKREENSLVKQLDLLYIQQGLERLSAAGGVALLPEVLQISVPTIIPSTGTINSPTAVPSSGSITNKTWSLAFHFLLRLLPSWQLPDRFSQENDSLKEQVGLSVAQSDVLASWMCKFLLYDGKRIGPQNRTDGDVQPVERRYANLSESEVEFFSPFDENLQGRSAVAQLQIVKAKVGSFLFTSVFTDAQRFLPAVVLTSDSSNLEAFRIGDMMFKQCEFDLESPGHIDDLFSLYDSGKPKIQIRILALLSKSKQATTKSVHILTMLEEQLSSGIEGLEANKLRTALFGLLDWTIKVGDDSQLKEMASTAQQIMRDFIEVQGWPSPIHAVGNGGLLSTAQLDMRQKAYSCIGNLMSKGPPDIHLIKFLFTSLRCDNSGREVHANINDAVGRAVNSFDAGGVEEDVHILKSLLVEGMTLKIGQEDTNGYVTAWDTRYATVKCANKCLPFHDVDARWIDLVALGARNSQTEHVSQELAEEGARGLDMYLYSLRSGGTGTHIPKFAALVQRIFADTSETTAPSLADSVSFCRNVLILEALSESGKAPVLEPEWKRHLDGLISNDEETRRLLRQYLLASSQSTFPNSVAAGAAELLTAAVHGLPLGLEECTDVAYELCSLIPNAQLIALKDIDSLLRSRGLLSTNGRIQDRAARTLGVLQSLHVRQNALSKITPNLVPDFAEWQTAVGLDVIRIKGSLLHVGFFLTRAALRNSSDYLDPASQISGQLQKIIGESRDESLKDAASLVVAQFCLCLPTRLALGWDVRKLLENMLQMAKKEKEVAINAIGRLIRFMSFQNDEPFVTEALESLYALYEIRKPELHFAVGESLAVAAAGWNSTSTVTEFDVDEDQPASPVNEALLSKILSRAMEDCLKTKPSLKKAAAIWLLSLVQYCGKADSVRSQLRNCQATFARLLTDRDEVVQETGSRGLSLVFEMGDAAIRDDLIRDLVQSFTGTSAKMSGSVSEDTQLFEEGALPTEGGASVTTYKDIVSLASEMGDPSLVYRFMNLASNNAIWTTRAAFGRFGLSNILADSSYLAENKKFYPKLFRYRFDPNPNVQRSMNDIWKALVKNPSKVIDENFDLVIKDLLKSILGKEWRVREASCAALADLIQDRDVEKYEGYLGEIWGVAFKVMDDIKESVRAAALTLCRTLTNLLIRNLEVGDGMTKRASILLEHALTFLLKQFTTGGAKEVQAYSIVSLLEVIKKCPPKALRPHAPILLENLITSLSSLEHESINYLHLNAEKYGMTAENLDKRRVSAVNASPVTECIDRCLESLDSRSTDGDPQAVHQIKDAMTRLEAAFKESIGLPSKVGLSRVMVTLVVRHSQMFRPYVGRFVQLTRKCVIDRNVTISISFATSLAYLMRLTSDKQAQETARFAKDLYFNSEQASNRALAGEIVQAISKVSNDVLMRFATSFLPFAFLGRNDSESDVRERFDEVWKDNAGGSRSINLYLTEIVELIQANIKSPSWAIKHACSLCVADLVQSMEVHEQYTDNEARQIWPVLEEALSGKTWPGKEKVILAYPKFVKRSQSFGHDHQTATQMRLIALREARRTNMSYRPYAIEALSAFAAVRTDLDLSLEITTLLRAVIEEVTADEADHMEIDAGEAVGTHASKDTVEKTTTAVIACLFQILQPSASSAVLEESARIVGLARRTGVKSTRLALYDGARSLMEKFSVADNESRRRDNANEREKRNGTVEKEVEVFADHIAGGLVENTGAASLVAGISHEDESENLRKARASLGLALARFRVARGSPLRSLATVLQAWLAKERSRWIQDVLRDANVVLEAKPE